MIEITKDQCTRMLVWDNDESLAIEGLVVCKLKGSKYPYRTENGAFYRHAKPLPEPKPMTALDVMWWAGVRKVYKNKNDHGTIKPMEHFKSCFKVEKYEWNLLDKDRVTGEIVFLYDTWLEFNFDNCDMWEEEIK